MVRSKLTWGDIYFNPLCQWFKSNKMQAFLSQKCLEDGALAKCNSFDWMQLVFRLQCLSNPTLVIFFNLFSMFWWVFILRMNFIKRELHCIQTLIDFQSLGSTEYRWTVNLSLSQARVQRTDLIFARKTWIFGWTVHLGTHVRLWFGIWIHPSAGFEE